MGDMSKAEKDFLLRKHEQTMKLRAEYLKNSSNPFRHATGEGGTIFDAGLARYQAMRVNHFEHFKPTGHAFRVGMGVVVLPIILYAWALKAEREGREKQYRNGEVAYKDRLFKFI
ncbi:NADH dehydrogenase (ubiquinone) B15 subunit [Musca autumnalis]|uniref:NADH dehydrogenase (ubiquinone) B15 subunit n=1 Tax=Musca autumnalis TaxID=221902 RepID=UPI003CED6801